MQEAIAKYVISNDKDIFVKFCKDYKIFVDTCSLMHSDIKDFYFRIRKYLFKFDSKINVPLKVLEELYKNLRLEDRRERVIDALTFLDTIKSDGLLRIVGDKSDDNFVDNLFLANFTRMVMKQKVLLITQDKKLATDVLDLNRRQSVRNVNDISVCRINQNGYLSEFYL
ncbi:MAG: hypothetical protein IJC76_08775 [Lachnospiraceae bacterium]|nr:hypothetical protein [Lachnospiraceae bacterium]